MRLLRHRLPQLVITMRRHDWKHLLCYAALASGASQAAFAKEYTVTVVGTIKSGNVTANFAGGSLFGLPAPTDLASRPATVVFTIHSTLGQESVLRLGAIPYASQIVSSAPGITKLVTAEITVNDVSVFAGGTYLPDVYKPIVSRNLQIGGQTVTRSALRIWTSEKNTNPSNAAARAALDCGSPVNAPFTTDYRWNAPLQYSPSVAPQQCVVSILYFRASNRGWAQALGTIWVSSITLVEQP
jgi:hypothetical protein